MYNDIQIKIHTLMHTQPQIALTLILQLQVQI